MSHTSPFEQIRHETDEGGEYWSARELAKVLGYTEYGKFKNAIRKAETACEVSGQAVSDHIAHVSDMIATGKGAQREIEDVHLSRYACYLLVQNADPEKPIVALGQTYFAVQTRRAELATELAQRDEDQRRLDERQKMVLYNKELAATAHDAGVVTPQDFTTFQNHGYRGLYAGETAKDIAARKGLKRGQQILDHMSSTELAANGLRAALTAEKIRNEEIVGKDTANKTHYTVGKAVRQVIVDMGVLPPEQQPTPARSIDELKREEHQRISSERQPSLFGGDTTTDE